MALTSYGVNANEAVKLWRRQLWVETLKHTTMAPLMGSSTDSIIQVLDETQKDAGDRIRAQLRLQLSGDGVEGDSTLEGEEEALTTYTDDLLINQLRHAVRSKGKMSEQRIHWSVRDQARDALRDWWADRFDTVILNQAAGNTGESDTKYTGHNATIAPSSASGNTRILYGGGTHTTENSLSADSETFSLTYIDRALTQAKLATPMIRPGMVGGQRVYVMVIHPNETKELETNNTAGQITWFDIQRAMAEGGKISNNPLWTTMRDAGFIGQYKNVLIKEDSRVPVASGTTTVYRNVLLGAQAVGVGFGRRYGPGPRGGRFQWIEKMFDFDNQLGVASALIWGAKKMQFNSIDLSTIVVSAHSPAVS